MDLPDFKSMSPEAIGAWVEANDITELIKQGEVVRRSETLPNVDVFSPGSILFPGSISVTFRVPAHLMSKVDKLAGRDREGRSGVLRQAVAEYIERHAGDDAA